MSASPAIRDLPASAGWKEIPIHECGEPLVALGSFGPYTGEKIFTESIYFGETKNSPYKRDELEGALLTQFVRKSVGEKLVQASKMLPKNQFLLILDAYRPFSVQKALYDDFHEQLLAKDLPEEEAEEQAQRFISKPSLDPARPSPHNTGGSVDLTIIEVDDATAEEIERLTNIIIAHDNDNDEEWPLAYDAEIKRTALLRNKGRALDMGTAFDEVTDATLTRYYEAKNNLSESQMRQRDNRRLLNHIMSATGFTVYEDEWWHFDFGNQIGAQRLGQQAIYGAAVFDEKCTTHETMIKNHYFGSQEILSVSQTIPSSKLSSFNIYKKTVFHTGVETLKTIGSLANSPLPEKAHRLEADRMEL